jgi:hypothetical protein
MTLGMIVILYVVVLVLGIVPARQRGTRLFSLLAYATNLAATCWLLFLFGVLSTEQHAAQELPQGDSWMRWLCLVFGVLLTPVTIVSLVRGDRSRQPELTTEERNAAVEEMRRRYPASIAILVKSFFGWFSSGRGRLGTSDPTSG